MLRKLLLLLLIVFAFTEVNAQNIVSTDTGCGNLTYEFQPEPMLVNGKYDYLRIATPTILGELYGAAGADSSVGIQFTGGQWVFYFGNVPTNIVFFAPDNGELFPPVNGWIDDGSPCGGAASLELKGNVITQEHLVTTDIDCGALGTLEFVSITSPNGADTYRALNVSNGFDAISPWGMTQGAVIGPMPHILFYSGTQWEIYDEMMEVIFIQNTTASTTLAPDSGWVGDGAPCNIADAMSLISENAGVLPVVREEFSDIKVYPNPSNGFINFSNLEESSRVIITNIAGQIVKNTVVDRNNNRIDIQDLSQGFYFVELEGKKTIKLIKR